MPPIRRGFRRWVQKLALAEVRATPGGSALLPRAERRVALLLSPAAGGTNFHVRGPASIRLHAVKQSTPEPHHCDHDRDD